MMEYFLLKDYSDQCLDYSLSYRTNLFDQNRTELINTAKQYCSGIVTNDGIGVPVGFDPVNKKCIQGDTPIIDFLKLKIK